MIGPESKCQACRHQEWMHHAAGEDSSCRAPDCDCDCFDAPEQDHMMESRERLAHYLTQQWAIFLDKPISRDQWLEEADEIIDMVTVQPQIVGTRIRRDQVEDGGPCPRCNGSGRVLLLRDDA